MATNNTSLLYSEVRGKGPTIVLIHGYLCSGSYWNNIRTKLEKNHTVITIDLLGFGNSRKPKSSNYDYDEQLTWIDRTLERIQPARPVVMAGHSMGALIALRYSVVYPDKISRLVLFNLPLFEGKEQARRELARTNLLFRTSLYWRLHYLYVPILRTKYMKSLVRHFAYEKYKGMEEYMFTSTGTSRDRSLHNIIEAQKAFDDLRNIAVPTTIVTGKEERQAYVKNIEKLEKQKNIHVIFVNSAHHTPLEKPELIVEVLQQK